MSEGRARVGVSSCLLGERVRYDGKEKRVSWIADTLGLQVELVSICPEVGAGMPVPRPPIQMVEDSKQGLRLQVVNDGRDWTEAMHSFAQTQLRALESEPLDGYVFKARSPSCGLRDTPYFATHLHLPDEKPTRIASGLWAEQLSQGFADLPLVDESDLQDEAGQERFLARVQEHWRARSAS